jgi:hypothetical protein
VGGFSELQKRPEKTVLAGWLADDPVHRQPVSAPNSLISGKNTGKFAKSGTISFKRKPNCAVKLGLSALIPYTSEQGI